MPAMKTIGSSLSDAHYTAISETSKSIASAVSHIPSYYTSVHHKYADAMIRLAELLSIMEIQTGDHDAETPRENNVPRY